MLLMLQQNWIADGNVKQHSHAGSLVASFKRRTFYKWCWDNSEAIWKKMS